MPDNDVVVRAVARLRVTSKFATEEVVAIDAVNWVLTVVCSQLDKVLAGYHDRYIQVRSDDGNRLADPPDSFVGDSELHHASSMKLARGVPARSIWIRYSVPSA